MTTRDWQLSPFALCLAALVSFIGCDGEPTNDDNGGGASNGGGSATGGAGGARACPGRCSCDDAEHSYWSTHGGAGGLPALIWSCGI